MKKNIKNNKVTNNESLINNKKSNTKTKNTAHTSSSKPVGEKQISRSFSTINVIYLTLTLFNIILVSAAMIFNTLSFLPQTNLNNIISSITAIVLLLVPKFIYNRFKISFNKWIVLLYTTFVFLALVFGFGYRFYVYAYGFDKFIHLLSGVLISLIVIDFFGTHNRKRKNNFNQISPFLTSIIAFAFSTTLLVLWEVYEFSVDTLSYIKDSSNSSNMQRYMWDSTSTIFPQTYGLLDTMLDLIIGIVGAFVVSLIGYIVLSKKRKNKTKN